MLFRLVASSVTVAALLTACTSEPAAPPTTSTAQSAASSVQTTAPSATRTGPLTTGPNVRPGEKPPNLGTTAASNDAAGAVEFAAYYFRAIDWGVATNDATLLRPLSASGCGSCTKTIRTLDALRTSNRRLVGGRIRITAAGITRGQFTVKSDFVVRVKTYQQAERLVSSRGATIRRSGPSHDVSLVFVSRVGERWLVVDLGGDL